MKNQIVEVSNLEEFDQLIEREKLIARVTHVRLYLYNAGRACGAKAIRQELQDEAISPVRAPGMTYRLQTWCEDTRRQQNTAHRSGRKSYTNKAIACPVMAREEEA